MKAGWKTTEFWVSTLTSVGSLLAAFGGLLPPKYAVVAAAVSTAAYSISRGLAKKDTVIH